MKKLLMLTMSFIMAMNTCLAQDAKEIRAERKQITKLAKHEFNEKVDKAVKKEAKRYAKEGWKVKPGALPLEKQLEKCILMQYEYDENLFPKYILADASSIGQNYDAAKTQAQALAITNLAGQIQTEVAALVENTVANKQLNPDEAASIVETVSASKNMIAQSIGRTLVVMECYRETKRKNIEVLIRLAYNGEMAKQVAVQAVKSDLEKKGADLQAKLDNLMGL